MSSIAADSPRSTSEKATSKSTKRTDSGSKKKVNFQYYSSKELTQMLLAGKSQDALQYLRSLPEKDLESVRKRLIRNLQKLQQKSALNTSKSVDKDSEPGSSMSSSQSSAGTAPSPESAGSSPAGTVTSRGDAPYMRSSSSSLTNLGSSALMQAFSSATSAPPGSPAVKRNSAQALPAASSAQPALSTLSASERANIELAGKYKIGEVLGKGGFGTVLKAVSFENGAFVAIKQIDKELVDDSQLPSVMKEAEILKRLNHTNIVKIFGIIETKTSLYFVLEFVESGSLASLVKKYGVFPEPLIAIYIHQTLKGLDYLHSCNIVHRDIKGDNILITKDGKVKLADFGTAKFEDNEKKSQNVVGTPYWMAPEVIEMLPTVGPPSDVWSLGCTVIELLTGAPPYFDLGPMTALFKIVEDQLPPFPEGVSEELNDFLAKCFDRDAAKRPAAKDLLDHPFMKLHIKSADAPVLDLEQVTGTIRMHNQDTLRRRPAVFDMAWAPSEKPKNQSGPPDGIRPLATAGSIMRRPSVRLDSPPVISADDVDSARREKDRVESNVEVLKRQLASVKQECERLNKEEADLLSKLDAQYTAQSNLQKRKIQLMKLVAGLSNSHEDLKLLDTAVESLQRRFGKDRVERLLGAATARAKSKEKRAVPSSSSPTLRRTKSSEDL